MPTTAALIVAAGRGVRVGGDVPKQWRNLGGQPVLLRTVEAFARHSAVDQIVLVLHADDLPRWTDPSVTVVTGGPTRQESVMAGLRAVTADRVLIHDAARPLVSAAIIDLVCAALDHAVGAAPAVAVTDALWRGGTHVTGMQDREGLFRAQTPQGFHTDAIRAAHAAHTLPAADDVAVARAAGLDVRIVAGDEDNLKITHAEDFARAERLLGGRMDIRLGNGYDVHRFGPGDHVMLCGVKVPHGRGLQGHSDADVGMHAVTDAIYGALAQGDIGVHFPPSDPQWKGADSHIFLRHAVSLAADMGYIISNVDCTLVCEYPKIGPHQAAMRAAMAAIMGLESGRISVKATTSERLGFTGREEGIAALATASVVKT
ncbi:bifunctional 2-C-methyl-D-erythritol 4-phosphate cytidylyltransferase/2-C-methyl-D-erythritol 2,4-cyclodiphosphate synthase [Loktanella sp. DJP18]|uniref:bifunctional 2-C-methyl-D-erythritol 4-phosphate cytidylyltransferase/2-C-methyl-D-erythritol 2,4-cyclodiphosphate synthase n=1 Tax=Loktanella sp. DJP18 TaxID=3409788 RepID=UPI003BB56C37